MSPGRPPSRAGRRFLLPFLAGLFAASGASVHGSAGAEIPPWTPSEREVLRSQSLSSLPPLPPDPSNAVADDPRAVALGKRLFFDLRLSGNGQVSCGTCHRPDQSFTDDLPVARGMGATSRRTMPLAGVAYQSWFFWDGRKDSLWSQALGPIENGEEHGFTRTSCAHLVAQEYRREYEELFGPLPPISRETCPPAASPATGDPAALALWKGMDPAHRGAVNRVFANLGKAIAAYVRRILPTPAPFDRYVEAVLRGDREAAGAVMGDDAVRGLRVFLGPGHCRNCHSGPLFTNGTFHAVGVPGPGGGDRAAAIGRVLSDEFNCLGPYSDARPDECRELRFLDRAADRYAGAFKTPSLRGAAERPPYMHAGQLKTLAEVLAHYGRASHPELEHRGLTPEERADLEAFLRTLSSPPTAP